MKYTMTILMICIITLVGCGDADSTTNTEATSSTANTPKQITPVQKSQDNLIIAEELKLKGESGGVSLEDMHIHSQAYIGSLNDADIEVSRIAYDLFLKNNKEDLYVQLARYVTTDKSKWNAIHQSMIDQ